MWPGPLPEWLFRRRGRFARFLCRHASGKDKGKAFSFAARFQKEQESLLSVCMVHTSISSFFFVFFQVDSVCFL